MPAPIPADTVIKVQGIWAEDINQSGRAVHRVYRRRFGDGIGVRKVQELVTLLKNEAPQHPFTLLEWRPWEDEDESSEDSSLLLHLNVQSMQVYRRGLYQHEARWARRLRAALDGFDASGRLPIVRGYAQRQVAAYNLREEPYTADLDGIVAYRAWLPENIQAYARDVVFGLVPLPVPIRVIPGDYKGFIEAVNAYIDEDSQDRLPVEDSLRPFVFRLLSQVLEVWVDLESHLDSIEDAEQGRVRNER